MDWNVKTQGGELDVILETTDEFMFIECKTDPSTSTIREEILKLREKISEYPTKGKKARAIFWFWHRPSQQVIKILDAENIEYFDFLMITRQDSAWKDKKLDKLKFIFTKTSENEEEKEGD